MNAKATQAETRMTSLAADLRQRIISGFFNPGDRMPSVRELARLRGVNAFTAGRVYELLVAEGMVDARRGAGYFVAPYADLFKTRPQSVSEPLADSIWALRREYHSRLVRVEAGCGWLPSTWLFSDGLRTAITQVARKPAAYAGRYGGVYGLSALRRHAVRCAPRK